MDEPVKTLVVGCGNMGGALLATWCKLPAFKFSAVDRNGDKVPKGVPCLSDLGEVVDRDFNIVVLGIKPQQIESLSPALKNVIGKDTLVLSMAAGTSIKRLSSLLGTQHIVRMMPNLPVKIGLGVVGFYAEPKSSNLFRDIVSVLGDSTGMSIWTKSESDLNTLTVMTGCGPGFIFEVIRSFVEAGKHLGIEEDAAKKMAFQTFLGTTQMAMNSDKGLEELRNAVTSKKGATEAGLAALRSPSGLEPLMKQSFSDALHRINELATS